MEKYDSRNTCSDKFQVTSVEISNIIFYCFEEVESETVTMTPFKNRREVTQYVTQAPEALEAQFSYLSLGGVYPYFVRV